MPRPLRPGEPVPAFEAQDAEGRVWSDRSLRGSPYVLYFYPADETPGCIAQACAIRDAWSDFQALGLQVLGVSRDSAESHRQFAQKRSLPFPLLVDADGALHRDFGVVMLGGMLRRISYLVGPDGRVLEAYDSHLRPAAHAERMLEAARERLTPA